MTQPPAPETATERPPRAAAEEHARNGEPLVAAVWALLAVAAELREIRKVLQKGGR